MKYEIKRNEKGEIQINNEVIHEKVFNEELVDYKAIEREEVINDLITWIAEDNKDKELMKEDLKYLINLKDEYIYSSIVTNEYIAATDNEEGFNNISEEILRVNKRIQETQE